MPVELHSYKVDFSKNNGAEMGNLINDRGRGNHEV